MSDFRSDPMEYFGEHLRELLRARQNKIANELIEKFSKEFENKLRDEVSKVAVGVFNQVSVERYGNDLRIVIQQLWNNKT